MHYDFDAFLSAIKYLDKEDILVAAYKKHKSLDKSSTMYTMEARLDLQNSVGDLLYFLEKNERPPNVKDYNFEKLKPICENLIKKGQMDAGAIKLFQ